MRQSNHKILQNNKNLIPFPPFFTFFVWLQTFCTVAFGMIHMVCFFVAKVLFLKKTLLSQCSQTNKDQIADLLS